MIKSGLKKVIIGALIVSTSLLAETLSLVGIEGGLSSALSTKGGVKSSQELSNVGLKIGAEGEDYRIFLGARHNSDLGDPTLYENMFSYGIDIQYKFNIAKSANIFVGANVGMVEVQYNTGGKSFSLADSYKGADVGTNIHVSDLIDFELGARYMSIESDKTVNGTLYQLNNIATGYASLIFKWTMD